MLSIIFYFVDSRNKLGNEANDYSGKIEVKAGEKVEITPTFA